MSNPPEPPSAFAGVGRTPLEYVQPGAASGVRPGIVTALGVLSLVFAILQSLYALASAATSIAMMRLSSAFGTQASAGFSATAGATTVPTTLPATMSAIFGPTPLRIATIAFSGVSLLLSVWLLVAAIQTLRGRRVARRLTLGWATTKIIIESIATVVAAAQTIEMLNAINASMTAAAGTAGTGTPTTISPHAVHLQAAIGAAFGWIFSMAYPVACWIVLSQKSIRRYFATAA